MRTHARQAYPRGPFGRVMAAGMEIFRLRVGVDIAVKWLTLLNFRCRSASARRKKVAAVLPYGLSWIILDKVMCVWECMGVSVLSRYKGLVISIREEREERGRERERERKGWIWKWQKTCDQNYPILTIAHLKGLIEKRERERERKGWIWKW